MEIQSSCFDGHPARIEFVMEALITAGSSPSAKFFFPPDTQQVIRFYFKESRMNYTPFYHNGTQISIGSQQTENNGQQLGRINYNKRNFFQKFFSPSQDSVFIEIHIRPLEGGNDPPSQGLFI